MPLELGDAQAIAGLVDRLVTVLSAYAGDPVPLEWVPGTSDVERSRLAAFGAVASAVLAEVGIQPASLDDDLRAWLEAAPTLTITDPSLLADLAAHLRDTETSHDVLAQAYSTVVASQSRWQLGTFFTPHTEVEWMIGRWAEKHGMPRTAVDVGAGVGAFTHAIKRAWPRTQVISVDVNPVTLGLLAIRSLVSDPAHQVPDRLRLVREDFFSWLTRDWQALGDGRLVIGNPPYTRLQLLPRDQRADLLAAAGGLCGPRASLSALITAASLTNLAPDDGLCLLLPSGWLEADYAAKIRDWLWSTTSRSVELHLFEASPFADARVDAVALLVGPSGAGASFTVGRRDPRDHTDRQVATLPRHDAPSPARWRALFGPAPNVASTHCVPLSTYATVRRGTATGANRFFVLDDARRAATMMPDHVFTRVVLRLRHLTGDVVDDTSFIAPPGNHVPHAWLFTASPDDETIASVAAHITSGKNDHVDERVLCTQRRVWFDLRSEVRVPDILIGPFTNDRFRFVENRAQAAITNNLYGLTWDDDVPAPRRQRILAWLRSAPGQEALRAAARTRGGGVKKLEPRALMSLLIPHDIVKG